MTVRDDLAEAASTVPGVTAYPYYRKGTHPGHCFIRLERIDYPNPFGGVCIWNVIVVLPSDLGAAEQYLEENIPALRAALETHMAIDSVVPQQLNIGGDSNLLCAFINGHREED